MRDSSGWKSARARARLSFSKGEVEGEKGSLIASECKRFGVRWDTGRRAAG